MKKRYKIVVAVCGILLSASYTFAASPVGQWTVTFYLEPGLTEGATHGICFKRDHTWYVTTFPDANGDWFQKGDRIRWYGDSATEGTSVASFGQFITNTSFGGEGAEFFGSGVPPVVYENYNFVATKVRTRCDPPPSTQAKTQGRHLTTKD